MPLNCFGLHDWSEPFVLMSSESEPVIRCMSCGMIQRWYAFNFSTEYNSDGSYELIQDHQQGWNLRPFKPYFDVPDNKKGMAG